MAGSALVLFERANFEQPVHYGSRPASNVELAWALARNLTAGAAILRHAGVRISLLLFVTKPAATRACKHIANTR